MQLIMTLQHLGLITPCRGLKGGISLRGRQRLARDIQIRNRLTLEVVQACRYPVVDFWNILATRQD